jgi:hypothetical protein
MWLPSRFSKSNAQAIASCSKQRECSRSNAAMAIEGTRYLRGSPALQPQQARARRRCGWFLSPSALVTFLSAPTCVCRRRSNGPNYRGSEGIEDNESEKKPHDFLLCLIERLERASPEAASDLDFRIVPLHRSRHLTVHGPERLQ